MRYVVELRRVESVEVAVEAESPSAAVYKASGLRHGFRPEAVVDESGREFTVSDCCEACGRWLMEGDKHSYTADECTICSECAALAKEQPHA